VSRGRHDSVLLRFAQTQNVRTRRLGAGDEKPGLLNDYAERSLDLMKIPFMRVTDLDEHIPRQHHKEAVKDA
jgi:hypothetical protein